MTWNLRLRTNSLPPTSPSTTTELGRRGHKRSGGRYRDGRNLRIKMHWFDFVFGDLVAGAILRIENSHPSGKSHEKHRTFETHGSMGSSIPDSRVQPRHAVQYADTLTRAGERLYEPRCCENEHAFQ